MQRARLNPKLLLTYGFVELEEKDIMDRSIYSLSSNLLEDYPFDIHVVLSPEYPDSNPNSGIVFIYSKSETLAVVPEDLVSKEIWTEEDEVRYEENLTVFEALTQPIAWHVTTLDRLQSIIESLTLTNLKIYKK